MSDCGGIGDELIGAPSVCSVLLFATKYERSYPNGGRGELVETWDFLTRAYDTDAHFVAYANAECSRGGNDTLATLPAEMRLFVVDVDCGKDEAIETWRARVARTCARLPGRPFCYWTRNGARFLWRIKPRIIATESDARAWSRWYCTQLVRLSSLASGLVPDPSCRDWTRFFRVPHGMRDGALQAHGHVEQQGLRVLDPVPGFWPEVGESEGTLRLAKTLADRSQAWQPVARAFERKDAPRRQITADKSTPETAAKALAMACDRVRQSSHGARNSELYRQAVWIAELVRRGELRQEAAEIALSDAAAESGVARDEISATLRSARKAQ